MNTHFILTDPSSATLCHASILSSLARYILVLLFTTSFPSPSSPSFFFLNWGPTMIDSDFDFILKWHEPPVQSILAPTNAWMHACHRLKLWKPCIAENRVSSTHSFLYAVIDIMSRAYMMRIGLNFEFAIKDRTGINWRVVSLTLPGIFEHWLPQSTNNVPDSLQVLSICSCIDQFACLTLFTERYPLGFNFEQPSA